METITLTWRKTDGKWRAEVPGFGKLRVSASEVNGKRVISCFAIITRDGFAGYIEDDSGQVITYDGKDLQRLLVRVGQWVQARYGVAVVATREGRRKVASEQGRRVDDTPGYTCRYCGSVSWKILTTFLDTVHLNDEWTMEKGSGVEDTAISCAECEAEAVGDKHTAIRRAYDEL